VRPGGAFYAFPNIAGTGYPARQLQDDLLNEVGVALVSGTSFGDQGEGYIRFSYANSIANLEEATDRIARFLGR
jgi:aspartate/methionine/tyrosine aminotransferase